MNKLLELIMMNDTFYYAKKKTPFQNFGENFNFSFFLWKYLSLTRNKLCRIIRKIDCSDLNFSREDLARHYDDHTN